MGVEASKIDLKDPNIDYQTKGMDDPDGVGRIVIFREQGYDIGYDVQPTTGLDQRTRGEKGPLLAIQLYSKANFQGELFEVDLGNYPSDVFISTIQPSNVFSLTIPPRTTIKLFCGDEYDFGGKGGMSLTNVSPDIMKVESLPSNIKGQVRSVSVISHSINRAGRVGDPDLDSDTIITSERGDVITAGMVVDRTADRDTGEIDTGIESYQNTQVKPELTGLTGLIIVLLLLLIIWFGFQIIE